MGTLITLGINKMEIDWGKNNFFNNHSALFQKDDFEQDIKCYYFDDIEENEKMIYEKGAKKKLSEVKERLEILGYDLASIEDEYNEMLKEYNFDIDEKVNLTFEEFKTFLKSLDISKVDNVSSAIEGIENGYELGEYFRTCILEDKETAEKISKSIKEQKYIVGDFFENIHPYIILRILAENESNLNYYVQWHYNEVIEGGWVKKEDVILDLEEKNKILIVTEGKTDSFVIKRAIESLYPNIADFFEFIDMEENYPFTGVGNLSNFCLGLAKINIQNNIIILFDNDTTGNELYNKVKNIKKPNNLIICHLPNYEDFCGIQSIGPFGSQKCDINGKAVAIECFLDFKSLSSEPIIRWNNYNKNMKEYQGELENKEEYIRRFKKVNLNDGSYDCRKLRFLIDFIIESWINRRKN